MSSIGRKLRPWLYAALGCVLATPLAYAQFSGASGSAGSSVLQVFRSMTPSQKQQVLQQLGISGGSGASGATSRGAQAAQSQNLGARSYLQQKKVRQQIEARFPILRPRDWVVVEVGTKPLPPRPQDSTEILYRALLTGTLGEVNASLPNSAAQQLTTQPLPKATAGLSLSQLQQLAATQGLSQSSTSQGSQSNSNSSSNSGAEQLEQMYGQGWQAGPPNLLTPPNPQHLEQLAALIRSKDPYQLSRNGVLRLPGFNGIQMAGLTVAQATLRLDVDPALEGLYFRVTKLPLTKEGAAGLKPYGYDIFQNPPSTFMPTTNVPLPANYILGPGDQLDVQLYGNKNQFLTLTVGRDGLVHFPQLGPISVGGQRFYAVQKDLEQRVARQMIGVKASVTMGATRTIRVFVLGEAEEPGSYAVSGLATITSALYAAGGIKRIGSLRNIELKRNGQTIEHLDLYDLLIHGDTTGDERLMPGDVVFIPPVGPTVSAEGAVQRPAIYEMKGRTTVGDLVRLAGGLTPQAQPTSAWITRIDKHQQRVVLHVNLTTQAGLSFPLRDGDVLRVSRLGPTIESDVVLQGHVYNPGRVAYRPGMRLSDVISSVNDLKPDADLHYVLIRRELMPDRQIVAFSADLAKALTHPHSAANVKLMPRDHVIVFDLESGRDRIIEPILRQLRLQAQYGEPEQVVSIEGRVKVPGEYPLEPGMRVSDLLRAGGGLSDAAYAGKAELTRYVVVNGKRRETELIPINLAAVLRGDPKANIKLRPYDSLSVKQLSLWSDREQVTLLGQVRFPGIYTIRDGETLKSVLLRAGGLTKYAFPQGAIFTRKSLKQREQQQLNMLAQRTRTDLTTLALQGVAASSLSGRGGGNSLNALAVGRSLLSELKATKAVGRLVINLPAIMREPVGGPHDVILRNGDVLRVPKYEQVVTVIGQVQSTTSHLYERGRTMDDYIEMSGGFTRNADRKHIYIVRADGSVVTGSGFHFFRSGGYGTGIHPGDTIVVPLNTEKLPPLPEWQAITSILYNLAVASAAIKTVGAL